MKSEIPMRASIAVAFLCRQSASGMDVLLIQRASALLHGTWQMVSGKIEPGETAWEAALREVREETGLVPDRFYNADCMEIFYSAQKNCVEFCPVFVGFLDRPQEVVLSAEHSAFRWVPHDRVDQWVSFARQVENVNHIYARFVARPPFEFLRIPPAPQNDPAPRS